ncbi:MAG TPA: hypothetical protein PKE40_15140 [Arachnia sp.]|nr:hypothetical protein [Arachnia sp.]HMT87678.1 hypothetical protein [Arachnia sp.]
MALNHLIVVVPGIAGSNLMSPDGRLIWGHGLGNIAVTAFRPEPLAIDNPVVPTGLLQVFGVAPWSALASYGALTRNLKRRLRLRESDVAVAGPDGVLNPNASLVEFPYDFRQPMAVSAERLQNVIDKARGNRRVIVVAHSMGGLVARWWWGVLGGHRVCDGLITVGTPHRGAPKALDWLLNGVRLGPGRLASTTSRLLPNAADVLRGWPSMYELLPRYPAVETGGTAVYPHEMTHASPDFVRRAREAYDTHLHLEESCRQAAEESPDASFLAFYGSGHATASYATSSSGRIAMGKNDPPWFDTRGWEGGDGTVPAISATPLDRTATTERRWLPQHHLKLAAADDVVRHVAQFAQSSLGAVRGTADPTDPWIGLDYDEVVAAGVPSGIGFRLNGGVPVDGVIPTATIKLAADQARPLEVVEQADGWRAALPPLSPGSYEFTIELNHVEKIDLVETTSVVGVIEP